MTPPSAAPNVITTGGVVVGSTTKKLNKKQQIIMQRLNKYCNQLGIPDKDKPTIVFTKEEFMKHPAYYLKRGMAGPNTLGRCLAFQKLIYIAYAKHKTLRELDETLRHELIHYRFFELRHGKKFNRCIKQLKDGETWGGFYDVDTAIVEYKKKSEEMSDTWGSEIWNLLHPTKEIKNMVWQFQCFMGRTTGFWHRGIWKKQGWVY